jgi:hypothetical protein
LYLLWIGVELNEACLAAAHSGILIRGVGKLPVCVDYRWVAALNWQQQGCRAQHDMQL